MINKKLSKEQIKERLRIIKENSRKYGTKIDMDYYVQLAERLDELRYK